MGVLNKQEEDINIIPLNLLDWLEEIGKNKMEFHCGAVNAAKGYGGTIRE